jgi:IS5 family transposase
MKPSVRRHWKKQPRIGKLLDYVERVKAAALAKVEHPFHIIKNRFGLKKVRYRGLAKNTTQLFTLFGLANLLIAKRRLFELQVRITS